MLKAQYNGSTVAVKQVFSLMFSAEDDLAIDEFSKEVSVLSQLSHPYIVAFYGISKSTSMPNQHSMSIVMEFAPTNLQAAVSKKDSWVHWNDSFLLHRLTFEIMSAMAYLHRNDCLFLDLKPANVLLTHDSPEGRCKLCDFGLSRSKRCRDGRKHDSLLSETSGSPGYAAPEICKNLLDTTKDKHSADTDGSHYSEAHQCACLKKVDVYAAGITMAALVLKGEPFPVELSAQQLVEGTAEHSLRPDVPCNVNKHLSEVMHRCWSQSPADRPAFNDVFSMLDSEIMEQLCSTEC